MRVGNRSSSETTRSDRTPRGVPSASPGTPAGALIINTTRLSEESAVKIISDAIKDQNLEDSKQACKKILQDLILRKKAEIALLSDPRVEAIKMGHFSVEVANGIAHIEGHVHIKQEQMAVEDILLGIEFFKIVTILHQFNIIVGFHKI